MAKSFQPGDDIDRYELLSVIAAGGMGTVFAARLRDAPFERVVALKVVHPHLSTEPELIEMFLDEARIASLVNHPNVCQVLDFGQSDGTYFLVMEHLEGWPLSKVLARVSQSGPPARWPVIVAKMIADAAAGLHAAHDATDARGERLHVVHRDVSPSNLFLTTAGHLKVLDFGIASAAGRLHHTRTGVLKGKLAYLAPEMLRIDERASPLTDLWSLGVVLWEALTLRRLFRGQHEAQIIELLRAGPIPPPSEVSPDVPAELDAIVLRALQREPSRRTRSVRELALALEACIASDVVARGPLELAEVLASLPPTTTVSEILRDRVERRAANVTRVEPPARSRRAVPLALASAALLVSLGGTALVLSNALRGDEPDAPALTSAVESAPPAPVAALVAPPSAIEPSATEASAIEPSVAASGASDAIEPEPAPEVRVVRARREARSRPRAAPDAPPGRLRVTTPGGWAQILYGGQVVGRTPTQVRLPSGRRRIVLRPFGAESADIPLEVDIPPDGVATLTRRLAAAASRDPTDH